MPTEKGRFITLEGCEGSGKSTQLQLLREWFQKNNIEAVFTREPGGTPLAEKIREIILDGRNSEMTDKCEALLYAASRVQHLDEKIIPAIKEGKTVVCDRYIDSSFAYQAYARGLGFDFVSEINSYAMKNGMPDLTLFFDISPDEAFLRKGGADKNDRLEQSGMDFHRKVYEGYLQLLKKYPERVKMVDARKSVEEIFGEVL
ncbi:MAG: dTMP kinase, partial [Clostridia bacterium]|nr:dTMP kinase [Clostridia bacterium]